MRRGVWYIPTEVKARDRKRQEKDVRAYCEANDISLDQVPYTGSDIGKAVFGDLLKICNADVLVVADTDVVSNDPLMYYAYKSVLKRRHYDLVAVKENFGGYRLYTKILDSFIETLCQVELENEPIRKPNDRRDKAARGSYIGGNVPMGYKVEGGKLVVNPDELPVVEFIMDQKQQGKTMLGTVDELNARGYKTRRGKPFVISTVQSIWKNEPFYHGLYRIGKDGEWVKGQHEAILKE